MKFFWPLLGLFLFSLPLLAEENLAEEMEQAQRHMQSVLQQLQAQARGLPGDHLAVAREKVMRLAADEKFLQAVGDLWSHPQRKNLLWAEGIFLLFMVLLKAWRQSRAQHWFSKLLVGMVFSLVTWVGMGFVLPAILLGRPYRLVILTLWRTFWG